MKKKLTKRIENFVFLAENNTFVARINHLFNLFCNKIEPYVSIIKPKIDRLNDDLFFYLCKARTRIKRAYKYATGRFRVREFMMNCLHTYHLEQEVMVKIIEQGELGYNKESKVRYDHCKEKISRVIRANRRISSKRITSNQMTGYLNQYIHSKRIDEKHLLAN